MTTFTRLTVVGSARKAELVVPDDESVGGLIPRLMELLEEPSGPVARPLALVRSTGEQLDAALSAAQQELVDGEQLRLVRADDAPPPPEVADVTDVVGDSYRDRSGRWSTTSREAVGAVVVGTGTCVALLLSPPGASGGLGLVVTLTALATVLGRLLGRLGRRWPAIALTAGAAGAAVPVARSVLIAADAQPSPVVWAAVGSALVWIVLGFGVGVGLRRRPAVAGAAAGAGLALLPVGLAAAGVGTAGALAVTAAVATVLSGLLPWYALTASGLTGLDDQVLAGQPSRRPAALRTVDDAYRSLSWSSVAVALPLTVTAAVLLTSADRWVAGLGLLVVVVTALRTRVFPLTVQQVPLCLGAAGATLVGVLTRREQLGDLSTTVLVLGLVVVVTVAVGVRPAPHQRARLRRLGNLVEAVAVVALVPVVLGVFGVYGDLVGAFR